jgi:hypothetical protein
MTKIIAGVAKMSADPAIDEENADSGITTKMDKIITEITNATIRTNDWTELVVP